VAQATGYCTGMPAVNKKPFARAEARELDESQAVPTPTARADRGGSPPLAICHGPNELDCLHLRARIGANARR